MREAGRFGVAGRALALVLAALAFAGAADAATLEQVRGPVQVVRAGATLDAVQGMPLQEADEVRTAAGGEVLIRFDDGARLALRSDSALQLAQLRLGRENKDEERLFTELQRGAVRYLSGLLTVASAVRFSTPTATIGVRGTDLEIVVEVDAVQTRGGPALPPVVNTYLRVNTGAAEMVGSDSSRVAAGPGEIVASVAVPATMRGLPSLGSGLAQGLQPSAPAPLVRRLTAADAGGFFRAGALDEALR